LASSYGNNPSNCRRHANGALSQFSIVGASLLQSMMSTTSGGLDLLLPLALLSGKPPATRCRRRNYARYANGGGSSSQGGYY